jgi:hypothetical protein
MVLHVAPHACVLQRERTVIGSPPPADLFTIQIPAAREQENHLDRVIPFRVPSRRRECRTAERSLHRIAASSRDRARREDVWRAAATTIVR